MHASLRPTIPSSHGALGSRRALARRTKSWKLSTGARPASPGLRRTACTLFVHWRRGARNTAISRSCCRSSISICWTSRYRSSRWWSIASSSSWIVARRRYANCFRFMIWTQTTYFGGYCPSGRLVWVARGGEHCPRVLVVRGELFRCQSFHCAKWTLDFAHSGLR